jgi:hypothetical protein
MAIVNAVKSGNWSDTTVWSTSSLPGVDDDVFNNGNTVTVNISTRVKSINRNTGSSSRFILSSNVSLTANVINWVVGSTTGAIEFTSSSPNSAEIVGNFIPYNKSALVRNSSTGTLRIRGNIYGTYVNFAQTIHMAYNSGVFNLIGNIYDTPYFAGITNNQTDCGLENNNTANIFGAIYGADAPGNPNGINYGVINNGTLNIVGIVVGGRGGATSGVFGNAGILNNNNATINLTGVVMGGAAAGIVNLNGRVSVFGIVSGGTGSIGYGINNNTTGRVDIYGEARGGRGLGAHGVFNNANNGIVFVRTAVGSGWGTGSVGAENFPSFGAAVGLFNNAISGRCFVESIQTGVRSQFPTTGIIYFSAGPTSVGIFQDGAGNTVSVYEPQNTTLYVPISSDVRFSTLYNLGSSVGSLQMPSPDQINRGVPLDNNLVGTAVFDSTTVFGVTASKIRIKNSIGERISFLPTYKAILDTINNLN